MPNPTSPIGGAALTHKLGRRSPTPAQRARFVPIRNFLSLSARPIPTRDDYATKAQAALSQMMNNNREGCCVATWLAKLLGIFNAYRPGGSPIVATDAEVSAWYHAVGGPGDNGLVMEEALQYLLKNGMKIGGAVHKIDAFAYVDVRDTAVLDKAFHWFDGVGLGVNLTREQYANFQTGTTWDWNPRSPIIGGHAIPLTMRGPDRFRLATWAQQPDVTRSCVQNPAWAEEAWVCITKEMVDAKGLDGNGVQWEALLAAMDAVKHGGTPDIPDDPNPPSPDPGPTPQPWDWEFDRTLHFLLWSMELHLGVRFARAARDARGVDLLQLGKDLAALVFAFWQKDWISFAAALERVLADLGWSFSDEDMRGLVSALQTSHETRVLTGRARK